MLGKNTLSNLSKKIKFLPYIPRSLPRANTYKLESKDFSHSHHACRGIEAYAWLCHSGQDPRLCASKAMRGIIGYNPKVAIIYFSTCINRSFAPQSSLKDTRALQEVFESLCEKANVSVVLSAKC